MRAVLLLRSVVVVVVVDDGCLPWSLGISAAAAVAVVAFVVVDIFQWV